MNRKERERFTSWEHWQNRPENPQRSWACKGCRRPDHLATCQKDQILLRHHLPLPALSSSDRDSLSPLLRCGTNPTSSSSPFPPSHLSFYMSSGNRALASFASLSLETNGASEGVEEGYEMEPKPKSLRDEMERPRRLYKELRGTSSLPFYPLLYLVIFTSTVVKRRWPVPPSSFFFLSFCLFAVGFPAETKQNK